MPSATTLAEHYWLSQFYESAVFLPSYATPTEVSEIVHLTEAGRKLRDSCVAALSLPPADVTLAIYGRFFHLDPLIDHEATDVAAILRGLCEDLAGGRLRLPYIWGRLLHDRFNDNLSVLGLERLTNAQAQILLETTPIGVYQHGTFVSGPLGIIRSVESRWVPLSSVFYDCYTLEGTKVKGDSIPFEPAQIDVVSAYRWIEQALAAEGPSSEWGDVLCWFDNRQSIEPRTDFSDICPVLSECFFGDEQTKLFEAALKTEAGKTIRESMRDVAELKGFRSLPPTELARKLDGAQQLQLLLSLPTEVLVSCIDRLILTDQIGIPISEVRSPKKSPPAKNICFISEVSSLGIRSGHSQPFALLCSSILRAYEKTGTINELGWRLQSDPSRGIEVTLTDFIRREGPEEAVAKLILTSRAVTEEVCADLRLSVEETVPRTDKTVPRILWKYGFEIPRFDDTSARLNNWLGQFEDLLSRPDITAGEEGRERIRAIGVNLFVAVEKFLDHLLSFNVWLLTSDHWGESRFTYRMSDARRAVSRLLGDRVDSPEGPLVWKTNGENALGTQLAYLNEFDLWLDSLPSEHPNLRTDVVIPAMGDHSHRPFPFHHTALWADSNPSDFMRYKNLFKNVKKSVAQADVAGVRNGIDHQRDESRFPTEESLWTCVTRLKAGVRAAEQNRIYPVHYWFHSRFDTSFGTTCYTYKNYRGETHILYRPATVEGLPNLPRTHPVVFAPVNFLGAADALLSFTVMGESEYAKYWASFPRISKVLPEPDENRVRQWESGSECEASPGLVAESQDVVDDGVAIDS
jgi:hypothetical protein